MQKIYREYQKVAAAKAVGGGGGGSGGTSERGGEDELLEPLSDLLAPPIQAAMQRKERELSLDEKKYLLAAERGDIGRVRSYLEGSQAGLYDKFNINAVDPLGRSALYIAIEYENIEMIENLLEFHVDVGEALLHAINEEFVEAVELLLNYQDHGGNLTDVSSLFYLSLIIILSLFWAGTLLIGLEVTVTLNRYIFYIFMILGQSITIQDPNHISFN